MNIDFHFYGTATAAVTAGMNVDDAKIIANAAEFVDYFTDEKYWSNWNIKRDAGWYSDSLSTINKPQLTSQNYIYSYLSYCDDYWLAFHFPPGNKMPVHKNEYTGAMADLQDTYINKFRLRSVNSKVRNPKKLCRPYSQFVIDMIDDTIKTYKLIKDSPDWRNVVSNYISPSDRFIGDSMSKDTFALIFLGIRMHVLADTWAHQDFTGFDLIEINHVEGLVSADVSQTGTQEKAVFSAYSWTSNVDTDVVYLPKSGKGHSNLGHYPDYGWLTFRYTPQWRVNPDDIIIRNNPEQFIEAWIQIATVIALCLNQPICPDIPDKVMQDIKTRFDLDQSQVSASIQCDKQWASNSASNMNIVNVMRWKELAEDPSIGVTHGLPVTKSGGVWIQNGSILHMYELAALMHYQWCTRWAAKNTDYEWTPHDYDKSLTGQLVWFAHNGWYDGNELFAGKNTVGMYGWDSYKSVFASSDGIIYAIDCDGNLWWYRHDGWHNGSGAWTYKKLIGQGWNQYKSVFASSNGIIYAISNDGNLYWYRHLGWHDGSMTWSARRQVGSGGWNTFKSVFASGSGIIYAVSNNGNLWWYRHDGWIDGSSTWLGGGAKVIADSGWNTFKSVFASSYGVIYSIGSNGELYWCRHIGWMDGDKNITDKIIIGHDWHNFKSVFASSDSIIYGVSN